jgi:hypothetical protein
MFSLREAGVGCVFMLCTFASAFAQTTAPETRAPELSQSQLAQQHVTERLAYWQQRLKLEEWRISVAPARRSELKPRTLGAIRWDKGKKTAEIWVLDPADYQLPFREMLDDMELTIVHELVHLELASLPRSEASRGTEEHAGNGIPAAMVALDRRNQEPVSPVTS